MKRREAIGFVTAFVICSSAPGALAAPPHHHHHRVSALGGTCQGSASAIAQYCEEIPGARGGHPPGPGTPTLSVALPPAAVRRLTQAPRLWPLLRIPAAGAPPSGRGHLSGIAREATLSGSTPGATVDTASVWTPMLLVLAGIALLLGGVAALRRWRLAGPPS
jgi:hypothetical protein